MTGTRPLTYSTTNFDRATRSSKLRKIISLDWQTANRASTLQSGHLAAAATDVYEQEPVTPDNPLLKLPNMLTMPHTGGETYETYRDIGILTAQAIIDTFDGKKPLNLLNE